MQLQTIFKIKDKLLFTLFLFLSGNLFADGGWASVGEAVAEQSESGKKSILKITIFIGVLFVIGGIASLHRKSKHPESPNISVGAAVAAIFVGVLMASIPTVMLLTGQTANIEVDGL